MFAPFRAPLRILTLLTLPLGALAAAPAAAEEIPFTPRPSLWREAVAPIPSEVRDIVRYPIDHPRQFGTAVAGVGLLVLLDKPLTDFYQDHIERAFRGFKLPQAPIAFEAQGIMSEDIWMLAGIAGSFAYGQLSGDDRASRAAILSTRALAYSVVTSQYVLKPIIARKRPWPDLDNPQGDPNQYTDDPMDFFEYSGGTLAAGRSGRGMPSYHFTEYLAVARVYSGIYDNSPVPYGVAAVLAVSNIEGHHHWVSDMVAGGLIGYGIGSLVLKHDAEFRAGEMQALPVVGPDSAGVALSMRF